MPEHKTRGGWKVEFARDGVYLFELRHYPREAPKSLQAIKATVIAGGVERFVKLKSQDESAVVEMELKKGVYDLEAFFDPAPGSARKREWGALFVYAKLKK